MRASTFAPTSLLLILALGASAQDAPPAAPVDPDEALRQQKQTAVVRGCRWLSEQQQPDGSWTYDNSPLQLSYFPMTQGSTALACFALLKCGVEPDDPAIEKGFAYIRSQPLQYTYAVCCVLLAIEARNNYEPPADVSARETTERRRPSARINKDLDLARQCVEFLRAHQQVGLWRYPSGAQEDVSNTQYAMLALDAAERLGINVGNEIYEKVAARLVEAQEKTGDIVPTFPVPGADRTFRELRAIQEQMEKDIRSIERRFKRDPNAPDKDGLTARDHTETVERGAARRIFESTERPAMRARGWAYFLPGESGQAWQTTVNGSMTASGVAALFICKSRLEGTPRWERELKPKVDQALRDGAAWLAKNYSVRGNPGSDKHLYYYLYGFERAGILGLIARFGDHDWYTEGCEFFLAQQSQTDGKWNAGFSGTSGPIPDTCFALLFLARGTTPVINVPRRVMTGGNRPAPAQPPR
jgi:hypothetical protein